ncbi:MAG: DUF1822 family protein [Limnospira sp.]
MVNHIERYNDPSLPLLIPQTARDRAREFALKMPTRKLRERVYFNTLAIWTVDRYLQWMEIPTDMTLADSRNPVLQLGSDVTDLPLPGLGRLDCRPVRENQENFTVPPEVWGDRIGYVAVKIFDSLQTAEILGFIPEVYRRDLPLNQLQPLENLLDHLAQLRQEKTRPSETITLTRWLADIVESGWQTVEALYGSPEIAYNLRSFSEEEGVTQRVQLIDLGMQLDHQQLVLFVSIIAENDRDVKIRVRLHPPEGQSYLPPNVHLILISETGEVLQQVESRIQDNWIQLSRFTGGVGEQFTIQITRGDVTVTKHFQI